MNFNTDQQENYETCMIIYIVSQKIVEKIKMALFNKDYWSSTFYLAACIFPKENYLALSHVQISTLDYKKILEILKSNECKSKTGLTISIIRGINFSSLIHIHLFMLFRVKMTPI